MLFARCYFYPIFVCLFFVAKCLWSVSQIKLLFDQFEDAVSAGVVEKICDGVYRLITECKAINSKVSSFNTLYESLHTREPDLTIASFLFAFRALGQNQFVKKFHEILHGQYP